MAVLVIAAVVLFALAFAATFLPTRDETPYLADTFGTNKEQQ